MSVCDRVSVLAVVWPSTWPLRLLLAVGFVWLALAWRSSVRATREELTKGPLQRVPRWEEEQT